MIFVNVLLYFHDNYLRVFYCIILHVLGREIREKMNEHVAQLYMDLDGGFSHLAWLLPGWLPLPSFR